MSTTSHDIVAKLWNLCNVLKDGGINYYQYVIELTYLLFRKMAKETSTENLRYLQEKQWGNWKLLWQNCREYCKN